jgi:hypothetical protein
MPIAAADGPSHAAGLFKAEPSGTGITRDVYHPDVTLALQAGTRDCEKTAGTFSRHRTWLSESSHSIIKGI